VNQRAPLSQLGNLLVDSLKRIEAYEVDVLARREKDTIHVPTVGSTLSTAYEQLRNASEYSEGDLLQQRAIRRYLKRVLSFHAKVPVKHLAEELVAELTQAEYLVNDHTTKADVKAISSHIKRYYDAYFEYAEQEHTMAKRNAFQDWTLDLIAVRCEQALQGHIRQLMFAHFAVTYLHDKVNRKKLLKSNEKINEGDLSIVLYIAVHRALLKSDNATIRSVLVDSYKQDVDDLEKFVDFNEKLDRLFKSKTTVYATRVVSKNGAALRFIYSGFYSNSAPMTTHSLKSPEALEQSMHRHVEDEYNSLNKRLNVGIVRSIIFLLITKGVVGFAVEVPYDVLIHGAILWMPLLINLFFPAMFIAFTRLTLTTPIARNTTAVVNQVSGMLFKDDKDAYPIRVKGDTSSIGFNSIYALIFLAVFAGLTYLLYIVQFNIVQGIIFFIFLSTASFLAFRLSRQIHELEVVDTPQGSLSLLRDIIYMPFIYVGQQISYRYSQINIVATVLDILIELPLKTILRLVRQWALFLNEKKDELL
jgi:hypothetical protein